MLAVIVTDCRRICIRRRRCSVEWGRVQAGLHVTGTWRGSLGASFVLAGWRVRVLWSYGLLDRPSDCLYVRTISLSGYMERR